MDMLVGLDLGQLTDPAAASVIRRSMGISPKTGHPERDSLGRMMYRFDVTALKRYELGTPYAVIVRHIADQLRRPEFRPHTHLVIDATGIGGPIVEQFRTEIRESNYPHVTVWAVTITAGRACTPAGRNGFHTAKVELVSAIHGAMGTGRLVVPSSLPYADVLKRELADFQVRITPSANETFSARQGKHDDLLLSVALPIWLASHPRAAMLEPEPGDTSLTREYAAMDQEVREAREAEEEAFARERGETTPRMAAERARLRELANTDPFSPELWEET